MIIYVDSKVTSLCVCLREKEREYKIVKEWEVVQRSADN